MKVIVELKLDNYDINTITHLVCDEIISLEEAKQSYAFQRMSSVDQLGWQRMVNRCINDNKTRGGKANAS